MNRLVVAGALAAVFAACDETPVDLPRETTLVVPAEAMTLFVGEATAVSAHVLDQQGKVLNSANVSWHSTAPMVAAVNAAGAVQAYSPGTAELVATYGGLTGTIEVNVVADERSRIASLEFLEEAGAYHVNQTPVDVPFRALDGTGAVRCSGLTAQQPYSLTSSDASVAQASLVNNTCQVRLTLFGSGQTTIALTVNGLTATYDVTVVQTLYGLFIQSVDPNPAVVGDTVTVQARIIDQNGDPVAGTTVNFTASRGALSATGVATDAAGIATVQFYVPTDLSVLGTVPAVISAVAQMPDGEVQDDATFVSYTVDETVALRFWQQVDGEFQEVSSESLSLVVDQNHYIYVTTYDRFGNVTIADVDWDADAAGVIQSWGTAIFVDGMLPGRRHNVLVNHDTAEDVTLTLTITSAGGEEFEVEYLLNFVPPAS